MAQLFERAAAPGALEVAVLGARQGTEELEADSADRRRDQRLLRKEQNVVPADRRGDLVPPDRHRADRERLGESESPSAGRLDSPGAPKGRGFRGRGEAIFDGPGLAGGGRLAQLDPAGSGLRPEVRGCGVLASPGADLRSGRELLRVSPDP